MWGIARYVRQAGQAQRMRARSGAAFDSIVNARQSKGAATMTPEEARRRARAIVEGQKEGQVIQLKADGSLTTTSDSLFLKKTVLHDKRGEY